MKVHFHLILLLVLTLSPVYTEVMSGPEGIKDSPLPPPPSQPEQNLQLLFPEDKGQEKLSGCYIVDPNTIGLKYGKAMVPLRHIDYNIEIVNSLVHITLEQEYENPSGKFLNVRYSFPIQPDSSMYKFVAKFGNVVVEGVVKEKEEAKKEFEKAKQEGRQAVLATLDVNSKDIINMEIGNIPPKTKVQVTISLVQELSLGMNIFYQLQVPSTISPRYMNSIPNVDYKEAPAASTLSIPSTFIARALNKPDYTWSFVVTLRTSNKIVFYNSPSHKLVKTFTSDDQTVNMFSLEKEMIPNKDLVFVYTPEDFDLPNYVLGENENSTTVMVSFIPRFSQLKAEDAYEKFKEKKEQEFSINSVKGEYIFILDRSGSMGGQKIQQAKKSLIIFLRSLPIDSYFNVISFGSNYEKMFPESVAYEDQSIKDAISRVQQMSADFGGTQIYYPLENALKQQIIDGYPRFVFLLTDGSVSDTENVILMAKKNSRFSRISTIGIGNGASLRLIQGCAEVGRGKFVMISDNENPNSKIISLLKSSLTPLIKKITLNYDSTNLQSIFPNPLTLPYILKDSIVNFYLTYRGKVEEPKTISLEYEDPINKKIRKSEVIVSNSTKSYPFVDKLAHFKVLRTLEDLSKDSNIKAIDYIDYKGEVKDYKQQAISYSVQYQILSEYTSFIAVGKELVDKEKNLFKWLGSQLVEVQQTKPVQYQEPDVSFSPPPFSGGSIMSGLVMSAAPSVSSYSSSFYSPVRMTTSSYSLRALPASLAPVYKSAAPVIGSASPSIGSTSSAMLPAAPVVQSASPDPASVSAPSSTTNPLTIDELVGYQSITGAWSDESLIQKLAKDPAVASKLAAEIGKDVVVTKLALLWLQKQKPDAAYSIIIQKAEEWLAKKIATNKIDEGKLKMLEAA